MHPPLEFNKYQHFAIVTSEPIFKRINTVILSAHHLQPNVEGVKKMHLIDAFFLLLHTCVYICK